MLGNWKPAIVDGKKSPGYLQLESKFYGLIGNRIQLIRDPEEFQRKDCADLGSLFVAFLSREPANFDLKNFVSSDLSTVLEEVCSKFNTYGCDETQKVLLDSPLISIIQDLLANQLTASDVVVHLESW